MGLELWYTLQVGGEKPPFQIFQKFRASANKKDIKQKGYIVQGKVRHQ